MKIFSLVLAIGLAAGCSAEAQRSQQRELEQAKRAADIKKYADVLKQEGRMPEDFGRAYMVLGQYGWHSSAGSSVGHSAPLSLLQRSSGGAYGAYTFYPPAFEQARRSWWIHGVMEAGSDILVPVNRNAAFSNSRSGASFSTGRATQQEKPTPNTMNSPIGHRIDYISAYDSKGNHAPIRDAIVIDLPRYDDGSFKGTLRLNKKAPGFAMTYDIGILPPDYVEMCACTMSMDTQ